MRCRVREVKSRFVRGGDIVGDVRVGGIEAVRGRREW